MAEENEGMEFHRRHIIPNLKKSFVSGFKELREGISEGVSALLPFAALAADPLVAFGLGGIQKGFKGLFGEEGLFRGEKETRSQESVQADELKENIKLKEQENEIRKVQLAEQNQIWEDLSQVLIDEGREATDREQTAIDAAEANITSLETAITDSQTNIADTLSPKLDKLVEIIDARGDSEEDAGRLQGLSGKALTKEITNLQKQQKDLFSGSPPYLQTISEYLHDFQYPFLETISTSLGNQETLSNALIEMEEKENKDQAKQNGSDYFTKTQKPILENISKSFEGMLNLQIKEGRFSEEKTREGEDAGKFGWLSDLFGKKEKKKGGGLLGLASTMFGGLKDMFSFGGKGGISGILMGALGKIFPKVASMVNPVNALILGLAWAAIDGLKGWAKAEDWGVSKVSGAIGGFFGGTADGGIKNAFMQSGKWALIGAGIGSFVPVVGTLIGGIIGAAIGGLLGWIGGEKIAKAMDAVGKFFKDAWFASVEFIKESWTKFTGWISGIWDGMSGWFKEKWNAIKEAPAKAANAVKEGWNNSITGVKDATIATGKFFSDAWSSSVEGVKSGVGAIADKASAMWEGTKQGLSDTWDKSKEIAGKGIGILKDGWDWYGDQWSNVFSSIKGAAGSIGNFLQDKFGIPIDALKERWGLLVDKMIGMWDVVAGWFSGIWDKIKGFFTLDKLLYLTPLAIPKLLLELWSAIKGHLVNLIPDFIPGMKKMAMQILGVEKSDLDGTTGTAPVSGQTVYKAGTENKALATAPPSTRVNQTNVVSPTNMNQNSSIFTAPNAFDPMMQTMNPGFQQ